MIAVNPLFIAMFMASPCLGVAGTIRGSPR